MSAVMNWEIERDQAIAEKLAREPVRQLSPQVVNKPSPTGLTPNQFELFNFNEEAFPFANGYISGLPDYLSKYFVKRYIRTFRKEGRFAANTWLRETMDKGVLSRVEGVMKRYPITVNVNKPAGSVYTFGVIKGAKVLHKAVGLDEFSLCDVENFSKAFADELQEMIYQFEDKYIKNRTEPLQSEVEIDRIFTALYQKMAYYTDMKGVTPPFYEAFKKGLLNEERVNIAIEKMRCEKWWFGQLSTIRSRIREHLMIAVGQVQRKASPYASREAIAEWRLQKRKNREFIKQMALIDEDGEMIELEDMFYKTVSNPAIRRCELMVRMRGFEEVAKHLEYAGEFYTLTAPSSYHAVHNSGGFVKNWNFSNPKDTQAYLCNVFAKIRASLARKGIRPFGFRVVEPHHDGTPHWHLLLFMPQDAVQTVRETFRRYALEEDGDEKGAEEHRFTAKAIDWDKGSATGYIAKYIAKNIDGYACNDDKDEETGESLKDMSKNVSAWAAKWRIRQFQQIGGSPVTVWRELRRKRGGVVEGDEDLTKLVEAADKGDWAEYTLLQGGPVIARDQLLARASYEDRKPNQYGEVSRKIIGFFNQKAAELRTILTRTKVYQLVKKSLLSQDNGERSEASKNSDHRSPWSSVNNCTEQKINNISEFLRNNAEELEKLKFSLELRHIPSRWITDYRLCRLLRGHSVDIVAGYSIRWNGWEVEILEGNKITNSEEH
ncbi:replication endonuclease [Caviibacterium pharyngocola]|uniref:Replication endonuclease n=1 Tax=Caviibacterium pharyngocola TaxID=28159 RepID=A0A2M8RTG5_9PAST|nr:replication endonuclease [Caviibacterium pharyngocola]PJG82154.1 replication endonuclease [Caviibacterium pharyngocola]